ncbi:MAG: hypothetical protein CM15mP12_0820 [Gammaproteobacteria bacterium]|nr:MAG: hypothetical protein CM15mP12_0820 [Gammaproteobacteria bacterium]
MVAPGFITAKKLAQLFKGENKKIHLCPGKKAQKLEDISFLERIPNNGVDVNLFGKEKGALNVSSTRF